MATLIKRYGMFTTTGNKMVGRIAEAGKKIAALDGCGKNAWAFAYRELQKSSAAIFLPASAMRPTILLPFVVNIP